MAIAAGGPGIPASHMNSDRLPNDHVSKMSSNTPIAHDVDDIGYFAQ